MDETKSSHSKKRRIRVSKKNATRIVVALLCVGLLVAVYYAGDRHGAKRQKIYDDKHRPTLPARNPNLPPSSVLKNRWSAIGTIQEVSSSSVKVKNSKGETQEAQITKDTIVTDKTAKKTDTSALKKDQKIIISGTKDDKGKLTATRIRQE